MAWEPLAKRLDKLPHVLAGPILRQLTPKTVTVWLALRLGADVFLHVRDESNEVRMTGMRRSIAVGKNLHIVAVTAHAASPLFELTEGIVYRYELSFTFDDGRVRDLAAATLNAKLAYAPHTLPSFAWPPKDPNRLRLLQGSCRMPHGEGKDTFPIIDDLIAETAANGFARPHQLLLTGDQIYADDVADTLLLMLTDAGDTLLGWTEFIPPDNRLPAQLPPYARERPLSAAGFTSVDLRSHLLSLGEYLSMYLFVWSDVLWPAASGLPTFDELFERVRRDGDGTAVFECSQREITIRLDIKRVAEFSQTLTKVRRALANIPSYMIFDDHEVTDDWNMTRNFCRDFYGKPLGQRVARNALTAYALCQHWGNVPDQFTDTTPAPPGLDLLRRLDTVNPHLPKAFEQKAASLEQHSRTITSLLGLHDEAALAVSPDFRLFHDPHSLKYHYTVEGPGHQVVFTDTRTYRSYPRVGKGASEIFPKEQFRQQILQTPPTDNRLLLVVVSTNAPPVEPIRAAARFDVITNRAQHHPDVYEAWEAPTPTFDRLLKALTDKLPFDAQRHHVGQVLLLSGDVHHSFASRLVYRATNRFEDTTPQPATAVIAQLVASAFKKETASTRGFHRKGYSYVPKKIVVNGLGLVRRHSSKGEGFVGWNASSAQPAEITWEVIVAGVSNKVLRLLGPGQRSFTEFFKKPLTLELFSPKDFQRFTIANAIRWEATVRTPPHYRYRLDYLLPTRQEIQPKPLPIPALPAGATREQRKKAAESFHAATLQLRQQKRGAQPKVVGVNNFGELTFNWGADQADRKVNHTLRWWNNRSSKVAVTTYTVSLNPDDADASGKLNFPDIKAKGEP